MTSVPFLASLAASYAFAGVRHHANDIWDLREVTFDGGEANFVSALTEVMAKVTPEDLGDVEMGEFLYELCEAKLIQYMARTQMIQASGKGDTLTFHPDVERLGAFVANWVECDYGETVA